MELRGDEGYDDARVRSENPDLNPNPGNKPSKIPEVLTIFSGTRSSVKTKNGEK